MELKIYSFFSGAGFLDLGFEYAGYSIQLVNEYDAAFMSAYQYARALIGLREPQRGYFNCDINFFLKGKEKEELTKNIENDRKNSLVGFIGGPPCPDFSVAGKNEGISGANGKLTTSYKKIILQQVPDFFLFENVKGLWATKKHREEYEKIKKSFIRKGYLLTEKLVNSLEYGVPQERERIILVGIHRNICRFEIKEMKQILKNTFHWGNSENYSLQNIKAIPWPNQDTFIENGNRECPTGILEELTIEHWFKKNDVNNHVNSQDYFTPRQGKVKMETLNEGDVSGKSYKRLHRWRYSPTVAYGNNEVHLHPYKSRRISVAEALALQSLPAEFVINPELSLTGKFKTIGNGVPFLMSKGIAEQLKVFLLNNIDENKLRNR
ncbi:DNA cytosine methyltransferase [Paenibacillus alkalitolerans]|uniref:DNA cytosine methyltransferase n=1 Tax=Paenibacillus alkalitolerans TaxID=2799335 RepID=UPI0018F6CF4A|nr:DNA cytosine methyltransferase [Paenibacillus alkalitolerans]